MAIQGALTALFIVLLLSLWDGVLGPVIGLVMLLLCVTFSTRLRMVVMARSD